MARIPQSEDHMTEQLSRQIALLKRHVQAFEEEPLVALDIATRIRVLCHDTKRQKSLLSSLGQLDRAEFPHTHSYTSSGNEKAPFCGLVFVNLALTGAGFIPKFDGHPDGVQFLPLHFDEWWNSTILRDYCGRALTRRDLILEVTDTDGGAHVDPSLNEAYHFISRQHSLSWKFQRNEGEPEPVRGVELASIFQIGFEFIRAFDPEYSPPKIAFEGMLGEFFIHGRPGEAIFGRPLPFRMEMDSGIPKGSDRNLPCKCGSGRKAKRCCPEGTKVRVSTDPL